MASIGQRLRLRLFLEGVEVPCIAASVQTAPNSPAMCSIQIPPLPEATRFLPRTLVHLFFLDFYEGQSPLIAPQGSNSVAQNAQKNPSAYNQSLKQAQAQGESFDVDAVQQEQYKLLFGGEIVGWTWSKSQTQRSIVLQCLDWSNYWDYAYQWNNTDLFGPGLKAMFSGGATNLFTDFLEDEGAAIIRILQQPSTTYPKLKGLLGGLIHLLEAIGGSYYYQNQYAGENLFFSLAELRLHITQCITAYDKDPTSANLLTNGYDSLFGRTLGNLGQQVSFRQSVNSLMAAIFHETYAIPTPCYTPGTSGTVSGTVQQPLSSNPRYSNIPSTAQQVIDAINDLESSLPKLASPAGLPQLFNWMTASLKGVILTTDNSIQNVKGLLSSALKSIKNAQAAALKFRPGAPQTTLSAITSPLDQAKTQLTQVTEFTVAQTAPGKGIPARLNQQIFRPDVWFSAPPRCNVLFPENYHQLEYSRNFLQEPTRFLLKTNDEFFGEDELFDAFYYAPKSPTVQMQQRTLAAMTNNGIMDHELFTGILPIFEKMGELNIFGARSGTSKGEHLQKVGLAQRSTNFLYFKHRFAARQMQVTGRFNPYIAPGFPGLIIDKWVNAQALADRQALVAKFGGTVNPDINSLLGTHFLGNFTQVEHTVDQREGRTSIVVSYPRQPEESVESLGCTAPDQTVMQQYGSDALRSTDVASISPPIVNSIGPSGGQIVAVLNVTQEYKAQGNGLGPQLPFYSGPMVSGTSQSAVKVPVGITQPASAYGQQVVAFIGSPTLPIQFSAWRVQEQVPRYQSTTVDIPMEEFIRPGWYGPCWHPAIIGQVYEQFFQTGAITDAQTITGSNGATTGQTSEASYNALIASINGADWSNPATTGPILLQLSQNTSIQSAVAFLVQTYSYVKLAGADTDEFIRSYIWRPIASMTDMFGSNDLQLSADGYTVVSGIEGFHSRAFGPYQDLFGLVTPQLNSIIGIQRGSTASQRADVRKRRQDVIKEYVSALQTFRGILG